MSLLKSHLLVSFPLRFGGARIKDFTANGVQELEPFIINNAIPHAWSFKYNKGTGRARSSGQGESVYDYCRARGGGLEESVFAYLRGKGDFALQAEIMPVVRWARDIWGLLPEKGDILIYCEQGANRSATAAAAVTMSGTGATVEQVETLFKKVRSIVRIDNIQKIYLQEVYHRRGWHQAAEAGLVNQAFHQNAWSTKVGVINTGQTNHIETFPELSY